MPVLLVPFMSVLFTFLGGGVVPVVVGTIHNHYPVMA